MKTEASYDISSSLSNRFPFCPSEKLKQLRSDGGSRASRGRVGRVVIIKKTELIISGAITGEEGIFKICLLVAQSETFHWAIDHELQKIVQIANTKRHE